MLMLMLMLMMMMMTMMMVLQGPSSVCLPLHPKPSLTDTARRKKSDAARSAEPVEMHILRRLKYDAELMLSCVIARREGSPDLEVFLKGNAVTISRLCGPSNLPPNWGQVQLLIPPRPSTKPFSGAGMPLVFPGPPRTHVYRGRLFFFFSTATHMLLRYLA